MQAHAVKPLFLAGARADIGHHRRDRRRVSMAAARQHHRQRSNHLIHLRRGDGGQAFLQVRAQGVKTRFQLIEPRDKRLIGGQLRKVMQPIALHEFMNRLFLKALVQMSEPIDRNQLLVADVSSLRIVTQALKTGSAPRIVHGADKHLELNQLNVHRKTILPVRPACLPFSTPDSHNNLL